VSGGLNQSIEQKAFGLRPMNPEAMRAVVSYGVALAHKLTEGFFFALLFLDILCFFLRQLTESSFVSTGFNLDRNDKYYRKKSI
jgi:hypothetical protein